LTFGLVFVSLDFELGRKNVPYCTDIFTHTSMHFQCILLSLCNLSDKSLLSACKMWCWP